MADNRSKRSQTKSSSPTKEHHKWNIPPQQTSSAVTQPLNDTKSSKTSVMDSIFDSGYDSQTVSKTSIDFESDFDQKLTISSSYCPELDLSSNPKLVSNKWSDSGLSLTTDSGLNIDEEFIDRQMEGKWSNRGHSYELTLRKAYEPDQDGDTYLHLAIIRGLVEVSYALIRIVPHPDFLDIFNHLSQTPLHLATLTRQPNLVRRLIISGSTVDLRDRHGNTALHIACAQSDYSSVRQLLAPIEDKEIISAQVVNYPVDAQHLSIDLLELRNYEGETCLHLAAYNKSKNIIEFLVKSGADINAQEGKSGKSVLHWSVENQSLDLIQFLVSRCRADVNVRSYAGHTPLHYAWMLLAINSSNNKLKSIIKYLCECGAQPSIPPNIDSDSDSPSEEE